MKESIYFDHAATSFPKPVRVMEKMCEYMKNVGCNVGREDTQVHIRRRKPCMKRGKS